MAPIDERFARRRVDVHTVASYAGLTRVFDTCQWFMHREGVTDAAWQELYGAIEELVANVMRYGSVPGKRPRLTVRLTVTTGTIGAFMVDTGAAFDPRRGPLDPELTMPDRVGGLGLLLAARLTDKLAYRRHRDRNHVRLTKWRTDAST